MSSSRIFKEDPLFIPTTLVQGNILLPLAESDPLAEDGNGSFHADTPASEFTSPGHDALAHEQPQPSAVETETEAETEAPVDLQALRDEAYNQGMTDMAARCQAEFQRTVEALDTACRRLDNQRKILLEQSRGDMINLVVALTRKIVDQELATPRHIIAATLQTALENAIGCEEYYVTLHPDDLSLAEKHAPEMIASIRGLERILFKTDASITRGGCRLDSAVCSVDATIETQVESLRDFLEEHPAVLPSPEQP
jgi:flagellar assembly protein FliH